MMKKHFAIALILLTGCHFGPKIDAKNKETLEKSIKVLKQDLDFKQQSKFESALMIILMQGTDNIFKLKFDDKFYSKLHENLHGKNYSQVIETAKEIAKKKIIDLEKRKNLDKPADDVIKTLSLNKWEFRNNIIEPRLFVELQNKSNYQFIGATLNIVLIDENEKTPITETNAYINFNGIMYMNYKGEFSAILPDSFSNPPDKSNLKIEITGVYLSNQKFEKNWTNQDEELLKTYKDFVNN